MGSLCDKLPDDYSKDIQEAVAVAIETLPSEYINERKHIIERMRQAAPNPYKNLLYSDYPEKNKSMVNSLAVKNVTSDNAKKEISDKINEKVKEKLDEKTADMNTLERQLLEKTIRKAIDESVNKAIDTFIKNIDKIDK